MFLTAPQQLSTLLEASQVVVSKGEKMSRFHDFLKRVGENVKNLRQRLGWTQVKTSDKAGIPERRYQEIEAGRANMTLRSIFRLAHVFKKKPKELL
jgi:DNA-binding XRE family transcriptional regulator